MLSVIYPLKVHNGKVVTTSDYSAIAGQHIRHAVETQLEELAMFPDYGLEDFTFDTFQLSPVLVAARESIAKSLVEFPDVTFEVLGSVSDDGTVDLAIIYRVGLLENTVEVSLK